jgi:hypothetical protein
VGANPKLGGPKLGLSRFSAQLLLAKRMRLYFHLVRSKDVCLPDLDGVEVDDPAQAQSVALKTMRQLFQENPSVARDWSGWRLDGTDETGAVLFSIALDHINRT